MYRVDKIDSVFYFNLAFVHTLRLCCTLQRYSTEFIRSNSSSCGYINDQAMHFTCICHSPVALLVEWVAPWLASWRSEV